MTHLSSFSGTTTTVTIIHCIESTSDVLREAVFFADVVKVDVGVLHRHAAALLCVRTAAAARNHLRLGFLSAAAHKLEHAAKHPCRVHLFRCLLCCVRCVLCWRRGRASQSFLFFFCFGVPFVKMLVPVSFLFLFTHSSSARSLSRKNCNANTRVCFSLQRSLSLAVLTVLSQQLMSCTFFFSPTPTEKPFNTDAILTSP